VTEETKKKTNDVLTLTKVRLQLASVTEMFFFTEPLLERESADAEMYKKG